MITLTDKGAEKVREFLASQSEQAVATAGLRVGVRGGGCSGFQYHLAFDEERDGGDREGSARKTRQRGAERAGGVAHLGKLFGR